ncbi:HupE/UreJ family protein [Flavobacterium sp.]|jgi:hypothetical protein|uniref:HupE/UreJ family protein n=1 Tax=Flavobacterium sp. TaxID=239 RepID=UPI0037BEA552
MEEFLIYFNMGLKHVLDIAAYDHIVFLIALLIPYTFKDWKRVFLLVSLFTLGHTFALVLSVFGIVSVSVTVVEFLIPITILITALYHLFTAGKSAKKETVSFVAIVTVCFGLIHGLGFSNYFNIIMVGSGMNKLVPLLEFALGIEAAQLIVVLAVLLLAYILQTFFRFSKRDWALVLSGCIIGVVLPMIVQSEIFK